MLKTVVYNLCENSLINNVKKNIYLKLKAFVTLYANIKKFGVSKFFFNEINFFFFSNDALN